MPAREAVQLYHDKHGHYMPEYAGFNSFCESMKGSQITEINLSDCLLDASATSSLADAMKFTASIVEIDLSGQPLTGATRKYSYSPWENIDYSCR